MHGDLPVACALKPQTDDTTRGLKQEDEVDAKLWDRLPAACDSGLPDVDTCSLDLVCGRLAFQFSVADSPSNLLASSLPFCTSPARCVPSCAVPRPVARVVATQTLTAQQLSEKHHLALFVHAACWFVAKVRFARLDAGNN